MGLVRAMNAIEQIEKGLRGQQTTVEQGQVAAWSRSLILRPNLWIQTEPPASRHGLGRKLPMLELRWDEIPND